MEHSPITINGTKCQIIPDGWIKKNDYESSPTKIVHLLKEATHGEGLGPELLENIRGNGTVKYQLWKVTARRSYCFFHDFPEWSDLHSTEFGEAFRQSAVVNLNDTLPIGTNARYATDYNQWIKFVFKRWSNGRRDLLLELAPDVIICGGTFETLIDLLKKANEPLVHSEQNEHAFWTPKNRDKSILILKAKHPSFRGKHSVEYEEFRLRFQKAWNEFQELK